MPISKNSQKQSFVYDKAVEIIDNGRKNIVNSIYSESTKSYYLLGKLIVEEEQNGQDKADYGKKIVENLSKELTLKYGRGFSKSTLWDCRKFYQKLQSPTGELRAEKSQSLTHQLKFELSFTHNTLPEENQTIFASKYKLYLPTKEELEN